MRVMQVHNRYRSAAPSGENRVVDIEGAALAELGHDVVRFERFSDDIETWSRRRKATMPAKVVWNPESRRELGVRLRQWLRSLIQLDVELHLVRPTPCRRSSRRIGILS